VSRGTIVEANSSDPKKPVCASGERELLKDGVVTTEPIYAVAESIEDCPPPEPFNATPVIIGTVLGLLALILLAILLWRLLAYLKDKKEWENYEKDKARSKWQADNNPIFKSSVAEFENPIFD